jgi:hypothetical protein
VGVLDARGVRLVRGNDGKGNSLVCAKSVKKGAILMTLPLSKCILAHRSGAVRGLQGQTEALWECAGDLRKSVDEKEEEERGRTWDVQLALGVLDATAGTGLGGSTSTDGEFWNSYTFDFPKPESLTVPFCYPKQSCLLSSELQNDEAKEAVLKQKLRLEKMFEPTKSDHVTKIESHRVTSLALERVKQQLEASNLVPSDLLDSVGKSLIPSPMEWAFAVVRSRCVKIIENWFGILPILDMANHSLDPSADVKMLVSGEDESGQTTDVNISDMTLCLCATRDLKEGDEVTISYGEDYNNRRLFIQYGFILDCNPFDLIQWDSSNNNLPSSSTLSSEQAMQAQELKESVLSLLKASFQRILSFDSNNKDDNQQSIQDIKQRILPITQSLASRISTVIRNNLLQASADTPTPIDILLSLQRDLENCINSFPTSLEEDRRNLVNLQSQTAEFLSWPPSSSSSSSSSSSGSSSGSSSSSSSSINSSIVNKAQLTACLMQRIQRKALLQASKVVVVEAINN